MKKFILMLTVLTVSIMSCQKEKLNEQAVQQEPQATVHQNQFFKNSRTLTIHDETGRYSIDLLIQSNNKISFDEEVARLNSIELKLDYNAHKKNKTPFPHTQNLINQPAETSELKLKNNAIYTTFKAIKIGDAKGFSFKSKNKAKSSDYYEDYFLLYYNFPRVYYFPSSLSILDITLESSGPVDVSYYQNFGSSYNLVYATTLDAFNYYSSLFGGYPAELVLAKTSPGSPSLMNVHYYY